MSINPELEMSSQLNAEFEQYDQAHHDPFIKNVIGEALEFNELMSSELIGHDEAIDIARTVNSMWGPIDGSPVTVTGNVTFMIPSGEFETKYFEDAKMISQGFTISNPGGNEEPQKGRKLGLGFAMKATPELMEEYDVDEEVYFIGNAQVDQVEITINGTSFMRARAWLGLYAPDLIDEVDVLVHGSEGSQVDALLALRELNIPKFGIDDETQALGMDCLVTYLRAMLDIEEKIPYVTRISGRVYIEDEEEKSTIIRLSSTDERLMFIHGLAVIDSSDVDTKTGEELPSKTEICLFASIVNNNVGGDDLLTRVPIDSLLSLESVRQIVNT